MSHKKEFVCPAHVRAWTLEEDYLLIKHHGKSSVKIIAGLLDGRTVDAVHHRIRVLRERHALGYRYRRFTADEITFIRSNASRLTISQIAKHLDRHPQTIVGRARQEGIRFMKLGDALPYTKHSDDDVRLIRALRDEYGESITFREIDEKFELPKKTARRLYSKRSTREDVLLRVLTP